MMISFGKIDYWNKWSFFKLYFLIIVNKDFNLCKLLDLV